MDAETPSWGRDRTVVDQGFSPEKKRTFHQRHFGRAWPRGNDPFFSGMLALEGLGCPHLHHDVIQIHEHFLRQTGQ